jgi:carbon storage regulator CsrA
MLVLSRRLGEELVIGGSIRVSIVAVNGDRVGIGVLAPSSVTVRCQEIHENRTPKKRLCLVDSRRRPTTTHCDRGNSELVRTDARAFF